MVKILTKEEELEKIIRNLKKKNHFYQLRFLDEQKRAIKFKKSYQKENVYKRRLEKRIKNLPKPTIPNKEKASSFIILANLTLGVCELEKIIIKENITIKQLLILLVSSNHEFITTRIITKNYPYFCGYTSKVFSIMRILQKKGWIKVNPIPEKRNYVYMITQNGREFIEKLSSLMKTFLLKNGYSVTGIRKAARDKEKK